MGFTVKELLQTEEFEKMTLLCGEKGLNNEIKGVTIIEAPDIVKFINGGELLLTGLYAFKSCTVDEFRGYIYELEKKKISGLVLKRGRVVEQVDDKIALLEEFAEANAIPVFEVPFEISFQAIMCLIMERLFNEEVTQLKYYKTTHDNFMALSLSGDTRTNPVADILDMLDKLIRNPVALFNQNMSCCGTSSEEITEFELLDNVKKYEPGIFTNYRYMRQKGEHVQYIVQIHLNVGVKMYLVITEKVSTFNLMDCIAVESAIVALQYEFSRKFAVSELEKKFQNDILCNILSGKVSSAEELKKSTSLLGIDIDSYYRVLVFGVTNEGKKKKDINEKIRHINLLEEALERQIRDVKIHKELDKVVVVQEVNPDFTQIEQRGQLKETLERVQSYIEKQNKYLKAKAGAGKVVQGILHLPETYKEANDAFAFADIAGDIAEDGGSQIMLFSDLGIFKLLCQLDDPEQLLEYVPESLQKLYDYKKPQREDLITTLKTYLERNQNLSKTAQDLFMHYKTAAYRIEKIAKITGMDFDNANEMLAVRIGLVVYKMIENYNKRGL
ncbi:MAG: PucR family transcriptional regulator ligand-binding domain-containing protein [Bariatricus massiliensis]|nr:PucR family transcriptional regulator ligand-binding domain-containing protein [Bariatricus massiliensis]